MLLRQRNQSDEESISYRILFGTRLRHVSYVALFVAHRTCQILGRLTRNNFQAEKTGRIPSLHIGTRVRHAPIQPRIGSGSSRISVLSVVQVSQRLRTLRSRLCVTLVPIIRRRQAPDVLRLFQIDSAVSRLLWVDIHDVGYCPFAC